MGKNYFSPEIETMPVDEIRALQSKRLIKQVRHVYQNVTFYRERMNEAGVKPEQVREQLAELEFLL